MKLGEYVLEYRERLGLSQKDFGKRCDLSHVIIGYIERGERPNGEPYRPRFETVRKLARGMGMSAEKLIKQCEDFEIDINVGPEEIPIYHDFLQSQSTDEEMILQAYREIPREFRIEAMRAVFKIRDKYVEIGEGF